MRILFDNETDFALDEELITSVAKAALEYEGIKDDAEISFTLTDNETIHELNKKHRGIDRPTDVLSFPLIDFETEDIDSINGTIYLGDIIISIDKAKAQAEEYGHSLRRELGFLTAHSMLHLLGYDHMVPEEEKIMFTKQEDILNSIGLTR
jgi:probable rRNA maturation factor